MVSVGCGSWAGSEAGAAGDEFACCGNAGSAQLVSRRHPAIETDFRLSIFFNFLIILAAGRAISNDDLILW
jgi:hypothetical protein